MDSIGGDRDAARLQAVAQPVVEPQRSDAGGRAREQRTLAKFGAKVAGSNVRDDLAAVLMGRGDLGRDLVEAKLLGSGDLKDRIERILKAASASASAISSPAIG